MPNGLLDPPRNVRTPTGFTLNYDFAGHPSSPTHAPHRLERAMRSDRAEIDLRARARNEPALLPALTRGSL